VSDGEPWEVIFESVPVIDEGDGTGTLIVRLTDQANQYVIADGMMVQFIGPDGQGLRAAEAVVRRETSAAVLEVSPVRGKNGHGGLRHGAILSPGRDATTLLMSSLAPTLAQAKAHWHASGLGAEQRSRLDAAQVYLAELPNNLLGWASFDDSSIWLDTDAAGYGWDSRQGGTESRVPEGGRMNLLTVLAHELGHLIGHDHREDSGVMASTLRAGVQMLPEKVEAGDTGRESRPDGRPTAVRDRFFSGSPFSTLDTLLSNGPHDRPSSVRHAAVRSLHSDVSIPDALFALLERSDGMRTEFDDRAVDKDDEDDVVVGGKDGRDLRSPWLAWD
jgi:hypothetical protein